MLWLKELLSQGEHKHWYSLPTVYSTHPTITQRKEMIYQTLQAYNLLYDPKEINKHKAIHSITIKTVLQCAVVFVIILFMCIQILM